MATFRTSDLKTQDNNPKQSPAVPVASPPLSSLAGMPPPSSCFSPPSSTPSLSSSSEVSTSPSSSSCYPPPHTSTTADVLACYKLDASLGLTDAQVQHQRTRFGRNELQHEKDKSLLSLVLSQFDDLLVRILLLAAFVSFLLALAGGGEQRARDVRRWQQDNLLASQQEEEEVAAIDGWTAFVEPIVILVILILNAVVGVWQESNAEKALEALKNLQPDLARCLRSRRWITLSADELVPGDVVEVRVGDKIPADLRVLQLKTTTLRTEQSQLTGESTSVQKMADALPKDMVECEIQAKSNCLFASTTIVRCHAIAIVASTGTDYNSGSGSSGRCDKRRRWQWQQCSMRQDKKTRRWQWQQWPMRREEGGSGSSVRCDKTRRQEGGSGSSGRCDKRRS
eukprot:GHVS01066933.1.p2 GENE.GHVS01066933.1~~GHVS01066933.1.p2  ORF type:complete len:397 (+),score=117.75 GHVS01066933.1:103-1293(+)